ncbi:MAG: pyridoxal-phosphate dependent enzyme [Thermoanaerobaculia bacterium]
MAKLGLETEIVDRGVYDHSVARFHEAGIVLPTFAQLADPSTIPAGILERLAGVGPDEPLPLNLFRVHWHNGEDRASFAEVPRHLDVPSSLSGVPARIVLLLGDPFPMIRAHKVLAAYGCLTPRIVTGQFDPIHHKAIWPSTGNYCRGGVAISRIMQCRGVAVLPEGMSRERFQWLEMWVTEAEDIIRTPGTESNVKEIYDRCNELEADADNIVFNQFSEFGNYLVHYAATGRAVERVFESMYEENPRLALRAFVSATGSAGTLGTGDYLRERHGSSIVAVEALECPTMLLNGFGEHNIQGIGDKHVPLIHNVMNTDFVVAVSDRATDSLDVLFNSDSGRELLRERTGVPEPVIERLPYLGFSSICNLVAAIKLAKHLDLGQEDVLMTVATDGAALYRSEHAKTLERDFPGGFRATDAAEVFGRYLLGAATDHVLELTHRERQRIFNLGYFTWVEQQGVSLEDFVARRDQSFWRSLRGLLEAWDERIDEFNSRTGSHVG